MVQLNNYLLVSFKLLNPVIILFKVVTAHRCNYLLDHLVLPMIHTVKINLLNLKELKCRTKGTVLCGQVNQIWNKKCCKCKVLKEKTEEMKKLK